MVNLNKQQKLEKRVVFFLLNFRLAPSKPTFTVSYRGTTYFNVSFDPTIMAIPASQYYVQFKENDKGLYFQKKSLISFT